MRLLRYERYCIMLIIVLLSVILFLLFTTIILVSTLKGIVRYMISKGYEMPREEDFMKMKHYEKIVKNSEKI